MLLRTKALSGLLGLLLALSACGSSEESAPPTFEPPPQVDAVTPPQDVQEPPPDIPLGQPTIEIIGVAELPDNPGLLCANAKTLIVGAKDFEGYKLVPVIDNDGLWPLDISATPPKPDPNGEDRWLIELDLAPYAKLAGDPVECQDTSECPAGHVCAGATADKKGTCVNPGLENGKTFTLYVVAVPLEQPLGELALPAEDNLKDSKKFTFDSEAPELAVTEPTDRFGPPTMSGNTRIAGDAEDNVALARVDVTFNGQLLASIDRDPENEDRLAFAQRIDLRKTEGSTQPLPLSVVAVDACGFETEVSQDVKVISWPWLRMPDEYDFGLISPKNSKVVDCDADGYPDILFATNNGVLAVINGGVENPGTFVESRKLTSRTSFAIGLTDLDGDGDLDMVVAENLPSPINAPALSVYRNIEGVGVCRPGAYEAMESYVLPISTKTDVVELFIEDFTDNGSSGTPRDDIVVVTDAQAGSILLFKRQNPDEPEEFDRCEEVTVEPEGGADAGADVAPTTRLQCPSLFTDAVKAGGLEKTTDVIVRDVMGVDGNLGPDGFPDIIAASENLNQINVFPNRFSLDKLVDKAFNVAAVSFVWPVDAANGIDAQFFCLENFVETGEADDPVDAVAPTGIAAGGTWRLLQGERDGRWGYFSHNPLNYAATTGNENGYAAEGYNPQDGVGTNGLGIVDTVCGDFDNDGHADFAVLSKGNLIMQFQLGDGRGRFNQLPTPAGLSDEEADAWRRFNNPLNEGIGFALPREPSRARVGDFDQDGYLDVMVEHLGTQGESGSRFSVYRNRTGEGDGFDLYGSRILVTSLGKTNNALGFNRAFGVADFDNDGKAELFAVTGKGIINANTRWLMDYHANAQDYRSWNTFFKVGFNGYVVNVWRPGTNGEFLPSWPAAYDHISPIPYFVAEHGLVNARQIAFLDIAGPGQAEPDGYLDAVLAGQEVAGQGTHVSVLVNAVQGDFWDPANYRAEQSAMFVPMKGRMKLEGDLDAVSFINPGGADVPHMVVTTSPRTNEWNGDKEPQCVGQTMRVCPWDLFKTDPDTEATTPFWRCPFFTCDESAPWETGDSVKGMVREAASGANAGSVTTDPDDPSHLYVLSGKGNNMTRFEWVGDDVSMPFQAGESLLAGGSDPRGFDWADLNGDGLLDFAVAVAGNVMVSFRSEGGLAAVSPVDKDKESKQIDPQKVVLTDLNDDGELDVVFTDKNPSRLILYLNVGIDAVDKSRQFHRAGVLPTCVQPIAIRTHDFDGDGCEELLVHCDLAGQVMVISNDTCRFKAQKK